MELVETIKEKLRDYSIIKYKYNNKGLYYYDICLEDNEKSHYLGCYFWDNYTKIDVNDQYVIIYKFQVQGREYVTSIITLYDIENEMLVTDTYQKALDMFNKHQPATKQLILHPEVANLKIKKLSLSNKYRAQDLVNYDDFDVAKINKRKAL